MVLQVTDEEEKGEVLREVQEDESANEHVQANKEMNNARKRSKFVRRWLG